MQASEKDETRTPPLSLDLVHAAHASGAFDALAAATYAHLTRQTGASGPDRELIGDFWAVVVKDDGVFWDHVLRRCDTDAAVAAYVLRCFRNHVSKVACPVHGEPVWLRSRMRHLLHANGAGLFVSARGGQRSAVYGLVSWRRSLETAGVYSGDWSEHEPACRRYPRFERRAVSERRGPYSDEDIIEGARRLLDIVSRYAAAYILSNGVERFWAACTYFDVIPFADPAELERHGAGQDCLAEVDEVVTAAFESLPERQRGILISYTLPRLVAQPGADRVTLHEIADRLGVSHQTVANEEKRGLAALRATFEALGPSSDELLLWCRRFVDKYGK